MQNNKVRPKKALGQHFLVDMTVVGKIADAIEETCGSCPMIEIGPGMGVLTQFLYQKPDFKAVEIDDESVDYLLLNYPGIGPKLIKGDFLNIPLNAMFKGEFAVVGNFPYNISSQIFFKVLDNCDRVPYVVCMIQKEVAERIAEGPGSKTYGILSVLLQAKYDIEYLFTVGEGAFNPPPKVKSAVIRLKRNGVTDLGCDEVLFKKVVKAAFNQRRKTLRNSIKQLVTEAATAKYGAAAPEKVQEFLADEFFNLRPEKLSVADFVGLVNKIENI